MPVEPLRFTLIAVREKPIRVRSIVDVSAQVKIIDVIAPPEVTALGKRWRSIESHIEQLKLTDDKGVREWMKQNSKTYYDWLRESLATRE